MNTQRVGALVVGLLVVGTFPACFTTVDPFTPTDAGQVTPRLKPNVMLLVDNSGSMTEPITGGGTRIDALKAAVSTVLTGDGSAARFGLAVFPENAAATQSIRVELPAASTTDDSATLQTNANAVNEAIQLLTPSGGTPTASSLAFVGAVPGLNAADARADFVVLITDGQPNLNSANPNAICDCGTTCEQARKDACACTQGSCDSPGLCAVGCLDADATIGSINSLRANRHITTYVVGFADDLTSDDAKALMNSMAAAGGSSTAYSAANGAELTQALLDIMGRIAASADGGM